MSINSQSPQSYTLFLLNAVEMNPIDDNVDVEVHLNGKRYAATFFTLKNIETIMQRCRTSGECNQGTYLWASDMIVVGELTEQRIHETIQDLIQTGEFCQALDFLGEVEED